MIGRIVRLKPLHYGGIDIKFSFAKFMAFSKKNATARTFKPKV